MATRYLLNFSHKHFSHGWTEFYLYENKIAKLLFSTNSQKSHEIRTRFAPSPTGNIHLGGLRAALYNYIFAKQNGGKFVLRIEDTDRTRTIPGAAKNIEEVLDWAGISPDESPTVGGAYGPYVQSLRFELYQQYARELVDRGKAYKCFCSPLRLELLRKQQANNRERIGYDGRCRGLSQDEIKEKLEESEGRYVVRFAMKPQLTVFDDMIFGKISNNYSESPESDPIILKSDTYPTYHFANIIDDHLMEISHVLRGAEWITSTPKHVQLYEAFDWQAPKFAHFPLIKMRDGTKMSKRNNQSQVESWKEAGYRPLAVLNFITNMGGGVPKEKQDSNELWDLETIVKNFNFNHVSCRSSSVDSDRLRIYNQKDLQKSWAKNSIQIIKDLKDLLRSKNITTDLSDEELQKLIGLFIDRIVTLNDLLSEENAFIWKMPALDWPLDQYKSWNVRQVVESLVMIVEGSKIEDKELIITSLKSLAKDHNIEFAHLMEFIRKLLTNNRIGLPVYEIFTSLGKNRLLDYLKSGLKYIT